MYKVKTKSCVAAVLGLLLIPVEGFCAESESSPTHYKSCESTQDRINASINLVNSAVAYYEKHGLEESLKTFTNQKGAYCTKYEHQYSGLIIWDTQGKVISYCKLPGLIGKVQLAWKSPDGRHPIAEALKTFQEHPHGAFFHYLANLNPLTNKPGSATFYGRQVGNLIFACPAYHAEPIHKDLAPEEDVMSYTKAT